MPDVAGLRLLHALPTILADNEVVEFAYQKGRAQADISKAPDVLSPHLHRVVSISCTLHDDQQFRVVSLGETDDDEGALIQRFLDLIAQEEAQLVSWSGGRFEVPVLHSRALVHGVSARRYWHHAEKLDLAQLLALHSGTEASLHEIAGLCGFPRTPRLPDNQIWNAWRSGRADEIHAHCETDAVICHLLFLRFQLTCGVLNAAQYANKMQTIRDTLAALDAQPWREFLADWSS